MADNTLLNVGSAGDTIRDVDKAGIKTPVSLLDIGGAGAEVLVSSANPMPVTASALPLPTGAATSAAQTTAQSSLTSIDGKNPTLGQALAAASVPVVLPAAQITTLTPPAAITGFATAAKQPALGTAGTASADVLSVQGVASMTALKVDGSAVTQPVSIASIVLPTGASTSAKQDTGNTSIASVDTKTPALGQALAAASVPVVLTAAQITTMTPPAAISGFALEAGHLATIDTSTARIPAQGQALAAASLPVVLTASQLTTLTPPAALTGFALDATLGTTNTEIGGVTETAPATDTASSGLNGRLQRVAQRITSLIAALGSPFQAGGSIGNSSFGATQSGTWTVQPGNTANTTAWKVDGSAVTQPASIADGSSVALGAVADASVTAGATGSVSAKLRRISADIGSLVTGTVLAAGSALIGAVGAILRTDAILNGSTSLTPKFAFATLSATGSVVALVASKKIRVLRYSLMADAACTVYFRTIATTTQISGSKYPAANGGAGGTFSPVGHFETVSGEALGLFIVGAANVSVDVTYVEV